MTYIENHITHVCRILYVHIIQMNGRHLRRLFLYAIWTNDKPCIETVRGISKIIIYLVYNINNLKNDT